MSNPIERGKKRINLKEHAICWSCGADIGYVVAGRPGFNKPKPNQVCMCTTCGAFGLFDENMQIKMPDARDMELIRYHKHYDEMVEVQKKIIAHRIQQS